MKKLGQLLGVMIILMIILSFSSVVIHFFFNITSIPLQEIIVYLHSFVFMMGIVYAFYHNKHVRIDIFYASFSQKHKRLTNQLGTLFLLFPFFIFLFYISYNYVVFSWKITETSAEPSGIPFVYGLKTLLLVLPSLMVPLALYKFIKEK